MESWGVIGGGLLGMRLAQCLALKERRVSLFEAAPELGGLASAWRINGITWDRHYHVILLSDSFLRALLAELDLEKQICWATARTGFYTDGRFHSMSNVFEFLSFPPLRLLDKIRLGATIFYASRIRDWRALEKIPVGAWLQQWSGHRAYEKVWLPLLRAKLGENHTVTSAAYIWAIIARLYAARRAALKQEMFGYIPGGYSQVLSSYAGHLATQGIEIQTARPARSIAAKNGRIEVVFGDGEHRSFDKVVTTVPSPAAAELCKDLSAGEKTLLHRIRYMGVLCASVLLRKPLNGFYVTNITDSWVPFTAVIEMSALVNRSQFGGHHLVYLPKYLSPGDPTFDWPDEDVRVRFLGALHRMHPHISEADVVGFRVSRARYVFPLSTLNYSASLPPMETSVPGLFVVNSIHIVNGTLNVNETLQLAERAAKRILAPSAASDRERVAL